MQPLNEWSALSNHLNNIVATLQAPLPKKVCVQTHGGRFGEEDIKHLSARAPALLVSVLRINSIKARAPANPSSTTQANTTRQITADLTIGISILTKELPRLSRAEAALNLAEFLTRCLPGQTFGTPGASAVASNIECRNLFNAKVDNEKAVNFWGCAFNQQITFSSANPAGQIPAHLFLGEAPDIGTAHQNDYTRLTPEAN
ncbi:Uncharacterised protein [BD1-7 clade bacterium]|uniref:Uncharacterized protein n=1 Tax=BD1-7 clade bacterium TaxID=2029982 RepID=A0A5S9P2S6_9GAMM|nr:Uncharacterised protein [BD1-7 clade bacterium]CAA0122854.1 Uncharacterised protein [BD1-7 clade bacterium]